MGQRPPRVLVVDDDRDTCANVRDILSELNFQVDVAYDGRQALEQVARSAYDVVLLDLKMPGMNGLEVYREIRRIRPETVALVITAYATGDTAREVLRAGAYRILSKPVSFPEVVALLDEALGQPLVLIVDDDQDLCASLTDVLRGAGYRVCLSHSVGDARQRLDATPFDVALIDMKLPDASGLDLLDDDQLRRRTVVMTGFRSELEEQLRRARYAEAPLVVYKPFDLDQLVTALKGLTPRAEK